MRYGGTHDARDVIECGDSSAWFLGTCEGSVLPAFLVDPTRPDALGVVSKCMSAVTANAHLARDNYRSSCYFPRGAERS
jgi:hypothetical protein